MTSDDLLATKVRLPTPRPGVVPRPRLLRLLDEGLALGRRLTLVSAPPGFGKTSAVREWAATRQSPIAWLTADEGDSDADRFVDYVIVALAQNSESIATALGMPRCTAQARLVALINALAGLHTDVLLVIDDYHTIASFDVHALVAFLLEHQPANLHLAIATREDPPLPLARLHARDQVTDLRERELRFTPAEAEVFLHDTMRLSLSKTAMGTLVTRCEGWITGLQLAGLALRQQADPDAFLATFAGNDRYILDYFITEVLEGAPDHVRQFLRQTSILDRLSAPLCDALTGRDDARAMLDRLDAGNLFLLPLDNRRERYRYHVLFADALRLSLSDVERIELHRRATAWFSDHDMHQEAARHAHLASDLAQSRTAVLAADKQPLVEPLTARELEVLELLADGYANSEIARQLYIAVGTVKRHLNNIYGKLGVGSRTQAVASARDIGLL